MRYVLTPEQGTRAGEGQRYWIPDRVGDDSKKIPSFDKFRTGASLGMTILNVANPSCCQRMTEH